MPLPVNITASSELTMMEVDESEIISQAELAATKSSMNLSVLKAKPDPFNGTVQMDNALGLPALPNGVRALRAGARPGAR